MRSERSAPGGSPSRIARRGIVLSTHLPRRNIFGDLGLATIALSYRRSEVLMFRRKSKEPEGPMSTRYEVQSAVASVDTLPDELALALGRA